MARRPRVLFLANWPRTSRSLDRYGLFAHWHSRPLLRFLGTFSLGWWTRFERRRLKFYVLQPLVALFMAWRYDAVIAFSSQCGLPLALLLRLCFWSRTKLIVFDVETFGRIAGGRGLRLLQFAARRIDRVIYAARGQEAYYDRYLPFLAERRVYIPLGIGDYEKKRTFDDGRDGPIVAFGHHGKAFRDWATLLRAYGEFADRAPLEIIGHANLPPEEREGVAVPPGVSFTPYLPMDELCDHLEAARFVVLPLPERGQSLGQLSVLLTMAMGKAVVASRVIGVTDYVADGETGLLVPPGDAAALAAAMRHLLDHPDQAVAMGRAARQRQTAAFGDIMMGYRWEDVFRAVTGRNKAL